MIKKMSEVFELPVKIGVDDSIVEANDAYVADFWTGSQAVYAARAINHVDALADALEDLVNDIENNLNPRYSFESAVAALSAYRGEK